MEHNINKYDVYQCLHHLHVIFEGEKHRNVANAIG